MVKFKTFNTKVVATEALVWGLVTLIGSQFFFIKMPINFILNGVTFIAAIIFGYFLIQSVKHEIKAKEDLKITNERLEDTTSLITHQIRGVFTRTKAGLSTIVDGVFGPVSTQQQNIMNQMLQSQENGLTEVETFLQAQKVESGSIQYDRKPFDVKIVVEEISAQEKPRAEAKGLQFEVTIDAGEYLISGDAVYLTQVIANLIDNAIRYTGQGSIKVHLSRNDDKILYSVKDTGAGIKDEDKAKMFTKYGHGANSRSINPSSSGLGLYIVKGIVDGHGGKIWYESEVNKGTTFFVELPVK
jgi:signal transduction histidine kinase